MIAASDLCDYTFLILHILATLFLASHMHTNAIAYHLHAITLFYQTHHHFIRHDIQMRQARQTEPVLLL